MIDSVIITLTKDMFEISEPDKFTPSAQWALSDNLRKNRTIYSKQNATKNELKSGLYKPSLTLSNRVSPLGGHCIMLKIEHSLPKLLFGNNFAELRYSDFATVTQKLVTILKTMGIITTTQTLAQASISAIHYSKNIKLTDGSIPYQYIQKIKQANVQLSLDVNQSDYRNEGHSYKWHSNSYEVVFYDKIKDLEKAKISNKRALEKDNIVQFNLLKAFKKRHMLEYLRMEVRLNKRTKIKQLFRKLGIKTDLTFKKLFKPAISKKILLHYLDEIESKRPLLLDYKVANPKALLADLIFSNPNLSTKQILLLFGLKQAFDIVNPRELRNMLGNYSTRTWYRLMKDAHQAKLPRTHPPLRILREQLMKFETVKLAINRNRFSVY